MTLVVDTGCLLTQANRGDRDFESVRAVLESERGYLIVPAFVVAEADYLVRRRLGTDAELALLQDLVAGPYTVECLTDGETEDAADVIRRYHDFDLGVADASIVVLARRFGTRRLLTFDERHFRAVRPLQGGSFTLLPADA